MAKAPPANVDSNRRLYATGHLAARFDSLGRWIDHGEEMSVALVADEVRGRPVLDIGMGAGRTVSLLSLLSDDYYAIDYSPALVERCREAYPDYDVEVGDARDLSRFRDGQFGLVMFSYNGIDSVDRDERRLVFAEIRRVLAPGGYFVFSTANKDGPWFNERPWHFARGAKLDLTTAEMAMRWFGRFMLDTSGHLHRWKAWWKVRDRIEDHGDWALGPLRGPGSGLVVHWTTTAGVARELSAARFSLLRMYSPDGTALSPDRPGAAP